MFAQIPMEISFVIEISTHAEVVTYPCRNATIVCDASQHILGSCICPEI
jgi:hypothetical protein